MAPGNSAPNVSAPLPDGAESLGNRRFTVRAT